MGYARNRPKLLHDKLRLIREYLNVDEANMAKRLRSEIRSHCKRRIKIKPHHISNFESGKSEPDMLMVLGYSLLTEVSMNLFADDDISVAAFRKALQTTRKRVKA